MTILDCVVVGAGVAGIAATLRLRALGVQGVALLEARARIGGRALTRCEPQAPPVDAGAEWLHAADRNPLVARVEAAGPGVLRQAPEWGVHAVAPLLPRAEVPEVESALGAAAARLQAFALCHIDRPLSQALPAAGRWASLQALFWTLMAGDEPERVSAHDHAAFHDTGGDRGVAGGLGAALEQLARSLRQLVLGRVEVRCVDWRGEAVRLGWAGGEIAARRVILTLPVGVLAAGGVRFLPTLPEAHREAIAAIAPGAAEKAWLGLRGDIAGLPEGTGLVTRTQAREAAWLVVLSREPSWIQGLVAGDLARELAREPGGVAAFLCDELVSLFGSRARRDVQVRLETHWQRDPFTRGAYSHVPPGGRAFREALAAPVADRLWFAGEACSRHAAGAVHGAWETGEAAAVAVVASLAGDRH